MKTSKQVIRRAYPNCPRLTWRCALGVLVLLGCGTKATSPRIDSGISRIDGVPAVSLAEAGWTASVDGRGSASETSGAVGPDLAADFTMPASEGPDVARIADSGVDARPETDVPGTTAVGGAGGNSIGAGGIPGTGGASRVDGANTSLGGVTGDTEGSGGISGDAASSTGGAMMDGGGGLGTGGRDSAIVGVGEAAAGGSGIGGSAGTGPGGVAAGGTNSDVATGGTATGGAGLGGSAGTDSGGGAGGASFTVQILSADTVCTPGSVVKGHATQSGDSTRLQLYGYGPAGWNSLPAGGNAIPVDSGGDWQYSIGSGEATVAIVRAFLLSASFSAPVVEGESSIPASIESAALASDQITRGRTITFSGRTWLVKESCGSPVGPGPCVFSSDQRDLWLDTDQHLHLSIHQRDAQWVCTEIELLTSLGLGEYQFHVASPVDSINENAVLGLFTYAHDPDSSHREIDFEASRWGVANELNNAQYVVQPAEQAGNRQRWHIPAAAPSAHRFRWTTNNIFFQSARGLSRPMDPTDELACWQHPGAPTAGTERARMNFWLYQGQPPSDGKPIEVVINDFQFIAPASLTDNAQCLRRPAVTTNLPLYPVAACIAGATDVNVGGASVAPDAFGCFRQNVSLNQGENVIDVVASKSGQPLEGFALDVTFDPAFSSEGLTLLYSMGPTGSTDVIDLKQNVPFGTIADVQITAVSPDNQLLVDTVGRLYSTKLHTVLGQLPSISQAYPLLSSDSSQAYVGQEIVRLSDQTVMSTNFPVAVDGRFAAITSANVLVQGSSSGAFNFVDLSSGQLVNTVNVGLGAVIFAGAYPNAKADILATTSYSYAAGDVRLFSTSTGQNLLEDSGLSDYIGQVVFQNGLALVGSYGNSYYGRGGIYSYRLEGTPTRLAFTQQFGASSVVVGPDGLVYVSTRYVDHFGDGRVTQGDPTRRGVSAFTLASDGTLHLAQDYFLAYPHAYATSPSLLIKSPR